MRALVEGREALLADIPAILSSAGAFFHVDDITTPYAIAGSTVPASIFETLALNEVSKGDNCRSYSLQTIISAAQKEGVAAPRVALERLANDALAAGDFTEARAHLKEFDPDGGEDRIVRRAQELFMELRVNDGPQAFLDASGAKSDHELRLLLSCVRELHAAGEVFAHEDVVACVMASIPTFVRMGQMHDAGEHSEYVCRHADAEAAYHVDNAVEILSLLGAKDALIALADGIAGKNRHCAVPYLVASIYEKAGATDRLAIAAECHLRRGNLERAMELYERSGQVPTREALEALVDGFCEFLLELRSGKTVYNEYDEPMPDSVLSERLSAVEKDFLFVKRMAERPDVRAAIAPKDVPYAWPVLPSSQQEVSDGWGESEDDDA